MQQSTSRRPILIHATRLLLSTLLAWVPLSGHAHVSFEQTEATVGGRYKAVLRVPHGCHGTPTHQVQIQIPEGVIDVRPQPKPGWQLDVTQGDYASPHPLRGDMLTEGVKTITWSGGNLQDTHYDEFVFMALISANLPAGDTLYFPVEQQCEHGAAHWNRVPAPEATPSAPATQQEPTGHDHHAHDVESGPAPRVKLQARR